MVSVVPGAGQVDGDPEGDGLVVAVPQPGQEIGVQAGLAVGAGGPDRGPGGAERVAGRPGPGLRYRIDRVRVVQVPVQVGQALLDSGQPGVVGEVAAVVVADQDPGVAVEDPEPGDGCLGAVPGGAVPDQGSSRAGSAPCARAGSRSRPRWPPRW